VIPVTPWTIRRGVPVRRWLCDQQAIGVCSLLLGEGGLRLFGRCVRTDIIFTELFSVFNMVVYESHVVVALAFAFYSDDLILENNGNRPVNKRNIYT
jgi:hypothetical protein